MACYEVASLRLSLFNLLGDRPAHERTHEVEELGSKLTEEGLEGARGSHQFRPDSCSTGRGCSRVGAASGGYAQRHPTVGLLAFARSHCQAHPTRPGSDGVGFGEVLPRPR